MILCIAIGNPLRGDDAVAHYALRLMTPHPAIRPLEIQQLTPELADDIARADAVIFLDADPSTAETTIFSIDAPAGATHGQPPFTHTLHPAELVALARGLYAFTGQAFLCHIPALRFDYSEALTPEAKSAAQSAANAATRVIDSVFPCVSPCTLW